jgi:UDP-2,3-diacylglucosamine pyrophosphatase LpxH
VASIAPPSVRESLLVFSDVHLGSDLNEQDTGHVVRRSHEVDHDLVALLRHYLAETPAGDRWRIVIAGDFIDFIGISVNACDEALATPLTAEETAHGLGNSADHARIKLRRVAERHADVFAALAAFVAEGHALTVVHGNHDVEFHWDEVKRDFRELLLRHAEKRGGSIDPTFLDRIEFNPWFFYWNGVAYIEHGHQYDPYCATEHIMAPLSPLDPRRIARGFCDVLLRHVVRPTRGMVEHGHENAGLGHYLAFGAKLGLGGMTQLGLRFARAVRELFRVRRESLSEAATLLGREHERRMELLAEATRIGIVRVRALAAMQAMPVTRSISGILASVLLDRLAVAMAAMLLLLGFAILGASHGHFAWAGLGVLGAWYLAHRHLSAKRKLDPADEMADRATHLARLLPAAFVVMGHTHAPVRVPVNEGASTYINLGSWVEDEAEPDAVPYRAARTHLVLRIVDGAPVASLLAWDPETGPKGFVA